MANQARPDRRSVGAVAAAAVVVALGIMLVVAGSHRIGPHAQPLPASTFAVPTADLPHVASVVNASGASTQHLAFPSLTAHPGGPNVNGGDESAHGTDHPAGCSLRPTAGHIVIPSLCVDAPVLTTHMSGDDLIIPGDVRTVGLWNNGAPVVGTAGTTLLAGHIDNINQGDGAFHPLYRAAAGAVVYVTTPGGFTTTWVVSGVDSMPKKDLPQNVFAGSTGPRLLKMVTCGGRIEHLPNGHGGTYNTYSNNIIVTAVPAR